MKCGISNQNFNNIEIEITIEGYEMKTKESNFNENKKKGTESRSF